MFQSTLPTRGATRYGVKVGTASTVSIHAPHAGSDPASMAARTYYVSFNPRSPRGERHVERTLQRVFQCVSIHAPHAGSDVESFGGQFGVVSIHATHAGSDHFGEQGDITPSQFQSTLPTRGATVTEVICMDAEKFQSTLPTRGATRCPAWVWYPSGFNPRSPRGERLTSLYAAASDELFQSTLPMRGATTAVLFGLGDCPDSIHAPHAGSDTREGELSMCTTRFNPRSPRGERPLSGTELEVLYPRQHEHIVIAVH